MTDSYHHAALKPGTMIQEYEVERVLGEGSFGIIYLAKNQYLDEIVAIKEFLPSELAQRIEGTTVVPTSSNTEERYAWGLSKFVSEAQILWELARPSPHPNIVRVSRFHKANGTAYMVMDFEKGEPLADKLEPDRTLGEDELKAMVFPLLDGLERIHQSSIWHRDIKPANIMIRPDQSPVLIDFGAARWELDGAAPSAMAMFTPNYAAPEQIYSEGKLGPWTDIYGLGATLYRAVVGRPPTSASDRALGKEHVPAAQGAQSGAYSDTFLRAIDASLALAIEERPQTAAEWRMLLQGTPQHGGHPANEDVEPRLPVSDTVIVQPKDRPSAAKPAREQVAVPPTVSKRKSPISRLVWVTLLVVVPAAIVALNYQTIIDNVLPEQTTDSESIADSETPTGAEQPADPEEPAGTELPASPTEPTEQAASPEIIAGVMEEPASPEISADTVQPTTPANAVSTETVSVASAPTVDEGSEQAPIDRGALLAQARRVAAEFDCAAMSVNLSQHLELSISGVVGSAADLRQVQSRLTDIAGVRRVKRNVEVLERPLCGVVEVLADGAKLGLPSVSAPRIELNKSSGEYLEGETLLITIDGPAAFDGYLYIDYFDSEGNIAHLIPSAQIPENRLAAGAKLVLGEQGEYEIAPPHGKSLITAVASRVPLFDGARAEEDTTGSYLQALEERLRDLREQAAGGDVASTYVSFTTREN